MSDDSSTPQRDSLSPFISDETPVKLPLKVVFTLCGIVASGAIAWGLTAKSVSEHDKRIELLETQTRGVEKLLERIDERTAEIKRRMDATRWDGR